jgi:hypothetical protein
MAMGRQPQRTIIVEWGELRPFSDIGGRHTIRLADDPKVRNDLAQRLLLAGCAVDTTGQDWLGQGRFGPPQRTRPAKATKTARVVSDRQEEVVSGRLINGDGARYKLELTNHTKQVWKGLSVVLVGQTGYRALSELTAEQVGPRETRT